MKRALILMAVVLPACGGEAVLDGSNGSGGTGGTLTTTSTSISTSTSTTSTSTTTNTKTCPDCLSSEYCDYPDNHCGQGAPAKCEKRPPDCLEQGPIACACDGNSYDTACAAAIAGHDLSNDEICTPPLDTVACGSTFCGYGTDYCEVQISDIGDWPDEYTCKPLPPGCSNPNATCACLELEPCGYNCEQAGDGSFRLICPGG